MKRVTIRMRAAGGTAALALALTGVAGCRASIQATGGTTAPPSAAPGTGVVSSATAQPSAAPGTGALPTTGTPGSTSTSASPALTDGLSAVYLTGLDTTHHAISFYLIEFLTGDAAKAEWKKEHPDNPDGPYNDYMIVNNDKELRSLPVAMDAQCLVLTSLRGADTKTITFAAFPAFLKQQNAGMTMMPAPDVIAVRPFWLTIQHGTVVKFKEQFLP